MDSQKVNSTESKREIAVKNRTITTHHRNICGHKILAQGTYIELWIIACSITVAIYN